MRRVVIETYRRREVLFFAHHVETSRRREVLSFNVTVEALGRPPRIKRGPHEGPAKRQNIGKHTEAGH
jgi:hypothetical protein